MQINEYRPNDVARAPPEIIHRQVRGGDLAVKNMTRRVREKAAVRARRVIDFADGMIIRIQGRRKAATKLGE